MGQKGGKICQSASPFFGLTPEYNVLVYEHIDIMVERGYSFYDMYTMPVSRRNLLLRIAMKRQEEEKKKLEQSRRVSEASSGVTRKDSAKVPGFVANKVKVEC